MAHTRNWDSGIPIDHSKFKAIPGAIAALALDIEERLQVFFYGFTSGETSDGIKYLPFWVQTTAPTGAANKVCLYGEDSNSKAALKIKSEDDVEIQLTERNWGLLDDFALSNNTNLRARNAADDGFVNLLKADGSNIPTIPDGARLASTAAPTQDYEIMHKKAVDDAIAGGNVDKVDGKDAADLGTLGAWAARSANTEYSEGVDGFIVGSVTQGFNSTGALSIQTPTGTVRQTVGSYVEDNRAIPKISFCCPVKKGNTWKAVTSGSNLTVDYLFWIPLGT